MGIVLKELLTVWLYCIVLMCCDIQGFANVAEYLGLMEYDTAIGHAVPNILQVLHSFNIFEGTLPVA